MTRDSEASVAAEIPVSNRIKGARRLVVKIGSSLVTNEGMGLDRVAIHAWAGQLAELVSRGCQVVLVSSGAVAEGVARLGLKSRPREVHLQQAAAAVGQMGLVQAYESCFQGLGLHAAQVLLSHDDLSNRTRYLNARSTLIALLELGTVPVINENDTVATAELCFGDNDSLAALVANLVNADAVIILTDQQGLFSADPRQYADAELIRWAAADDQGLLPMAGAGSELGRGGMQTKLSAARLAARSGADTVICSGREGSVVLRLYAGENLGTYLYAKAEPVAARKQWLAGQLALKGRLVLDAGAARVVTEEGGSLLPVGVAAVQGQFARGEVVACLDQGGIELARGLTNYASHEVEVIKGKKSRQIADLLGYAGETELIHRDNLVVV